MAVPTPHTWTAGEKPTSPNMQTLTDAALWSLGSATSTGARRDLAILQQTVIQSSIASGTAITFDTELLDYASGHSTVTNPSRYTAVNAGVFDLEASTSFAANTTGSFRALQLKVNGATVLCESNFISASGSVPNVILSLAVATKHYLNAGDYVEAVITHNATALNTAVNSGNSRLAVAWLSN